MNRQEVKADRKSHQDDFYKYFKKKDLFEDVVIKGKKIEELESAIKNQKLSRVVKKYQNQSYGRFMDEEVDKEKINNLYSFFLNNESCSLNHEINSLEDLLSPYKEDLINILGKKYINILKEICEIILVDFNSNYETNIFIEYEKKKNKNIDTFYNEIVKNYKIKDSKTKTIYVNEKIRLYDMKILDILIKRKECKMDQYFDLDNISSIQVLDLILKNKETNFYKTCKKLFSFFNKESSFIFPILLWIDSIHDFGGDRIKEKDSNSNQEQNKKSNKDVKEWVGVKLNKDKCESNPILYKWENSKCYSNKKLMEEIKKKKDREESIGKISKLEINSDNFLDYYVDLFFMFKKDGLIFSEDCKDSILGQVYNIYKTNKDYKNLPQILFDFYYYKSSHFEKDFFYSYLAYFFNFNRGQLDEKYTDIIDTTYYKNIGIDYNIYSILWKSIDFLNLWTQDFSKEAQKLSQMKLNEHNKTYLPSSLMDANKQTSNDYFGDFYVNDLSKIEERFQVWSGQNFDYIYNKHNCLLEVQSTGSSGQSISLLSSCEIVPLFDINESNTKLYYSLNGKKFYPYNIKEKKNENDKNKKKDNTQLQITSFDEDIETTQEDLTKVKAIRFISKGEGPSVKTIFEIIKSCFDKRNNVKLSFIDSLLSLKRIGDFGQIIESQLKDIPFFTDDKMEALISIAIGNTTITSCDDYIIWYDKRIDGFISPITYIHNIKYKDYCGDINIKRKNEDYFNSIKNIKFGNFHDINLDSTDDYLNIKGLSCE